MPINLNVFAASGWRLKLEKSLRIASSCALLKLLDEERDVQELQEKRAAVQQAFFLSGFRGAYLLISTQVQSVIDSDTCAFCKLDYGYPLSPRSLG